MLKVKIENGKIYSFIRDKWLVCTPEEEVRQNLVCWLVNECGYPLENMMEEYKNQYSDGRGIRKTRADIVIFRTCEEKEKNYNAYIVVECKAENVKIRKEDFYQGTEYAQNLRAQFLILHNSRETHFYAVDLDKIPNKDDAFTQIVAIPNYQDIFDSKKVDDIKSKTKIFTREEFTTLLFRCHNIIRNNDKLSPEAAFDEISKILFIKINFERKFKGVQVFTLESFNKLESDYETFTRPTLTNKDNRPYMQVLFEMTKNDYKDDRLFEENETIKIKEASFKSILSLLEKYNLSDTSDDVKGIAFEKFLGRTFRGELGQFFTPRTVVDFMTEILDPQEGELICDPCCGSGGFLIKAFDYIKEKIERDIQKQKDRFKAQLLSEYPEEMTEKQQIELNAKIDRVFKQLNTELEHIHGERSDYYSRLDTLSYRSIFGTDANPRMARTSKMNMIMHGDGHGGVHHHDGLININGIFENHFDVILTNPPFGANVGKDQIIDEYDLESDDKRIAHYTKLYGQEYKSQLDDLRRRAQGLTVDGEKKDKEKLLLNLYETGKMSTLTEVLFIERCLRLLKPGGRMGIVLPEGVLNNSNLQKVREYFEGKAKLILICSIPQDVFIKAGATVKPSLVFMKKFTDEETKQYEAIVAKARKTVDDKYATEVAAINHAYETKEIRLKSVYLSKLKEIEAKKIAEIKPLVKEWFDYQIPIAKVEKAGITTTGGECENELNDVLSEYRAYNAENPLWEVTTSDWVYSLDENQTLSRVNLREQVKVGDLL